MVRLFDVVEVTDQQDLPAGPFSAWLLRTGATLERHDDTVVPCGECTACCRSSYFIHIGPDETATLARIPAELLFAAPGQPKDTVLLGYDEEGCCPMLVDDKCSIYEHRPQTCRSYDCRIFAAAGIAAGDDDKALVTQHTQWWKFDHSDELGRTQHKAVQAAAKFMSEHSENFADDVPGNSTQLAILAIKVHDVFLNRDDDTTLNTSSVTEVTAAVKELLAANVKPCP